MVALEYEYGYACAECSYHAPYYGRVRRHQRDRQHEQRVVRPVFPVTRETFAAVARINWEAKQVTGAEREAIYEVKNRMLRRMSGLAGLISQHALNGRLYYAFFFKNPTTNNVWSFHLPEDEYRTEEDVPLTEPIDDERLSGVSDVETSAFEAFTYLRDVHNLNVNDYAPHTVIALGDGGFTLDSVAEAHECSQTAFGVSTC